MKKQEFKFYGSIGVEINADSFTEQLMNMEKSGCTDLVIRMHCYGGSVFEGNVIFNAIANSKINISIIIDGIAASMASIIILASRIVQIAENGFVMIHRPTSGNMGNADEFQQQVKLLNDMENNFINVISSRSGLSENEVKTKWFDGKDHWLNADEAVKFGFAIGKIESVAKDIKSLNINSIVTSSIHDIYNRYSASINSFIYKDWKWYQANAVKELEEMPQTNPTLFASLYKNEFGVIPSSLSGKINNTNTVLETVNKSKDWKWYQENAVKELEEMPQTNPTLFASLYKKEFGVHPQRN